MSFLFQFEANATVQNGAEAERIDTITFSRCDDNRAARELRLDVLREIPEDATLRQQWDALVLQVEQPQVFYTYEWALAVYRAYSETLRPLLFVAYSADDSLCGVAALATDVAEQRVSFLCATTSDYCDFLSPLPQRFMFVSAVFGQLRKLKVGRMAFANLPADSGTVAAIAQAAHQHHYQCFVRKAYVCAQVRLGLIKRGKDGRPVAPGLKRIRKFVNGVGPDAPVRFDHARSWDAVEPMLPQFMKAHIARFLETGRISNFANARRRVFLRELSKLLSGPQWVVLSRMRVGERVVAWQYGFESHGTWFLYQPTFDSAYEKYWPGFCLMTEMIQEATKNPALVAVDMGLGEEAYKAKFANGSRETLYATMHDSFLEHLGTILRYRVAEGVKAFPRVERLASSIRKEVRALGNRLRMQGAGSVLICAVRRVLRVFWRRDEIFFFDWQTCESGSAKPHSMQLCPLDLGQLAFAAMEYEGDESTQAYLLRSTRRLRTGGVEGFVLTSDDGRPLHFAWVASFDGFCMSDLNTTLQASPDCLMLFDCWTPAALRGRGYCAQAIELIADKMKANGKQTWIFCAATNGAAVRALAKAGLQRRYALVRKKVLWWQAVKRQPYNLTGLSAEEVSAHG